MVGSYITGSPSVGVLLAGISSMLLTILFTILTVWLGTDQIVAGVSLNLLATGLTGVLYRSIFGVTGQALMVHTFAPLSLPFLSNLPFFGPTIFQHTCLVYFTILLVPFFSFFLFHTRGGLQLRAVGEHPHAAETLGISVRKVRTLVLLVEGLLCGIAGSYLSLAYSNTFIEGMSAGRGFIALAIVVFGRWRPGGVFLAALFFGGATALQFHLQALGSALPYQFILMLPYVLTLFALAFTSIKLTAPMALGETYQRE
jgi:simple sugar transport system permease protein